MEGDDGRRDDLSNRVDDLSRRMDAGFERIDAKFDALHRMLFQAAWGLTIGFLGLVGVSATQL